MKSIYYLPIIHAITFTIISAVNINAHFSMSVLLLWLLWLPVIIKNKSYMSAAMSSGFLVLGVFIGVSSFAWMSIFINDL